MEDLARNPAPRGRVLVAEDEPHIRRVLLTLLEAASFETEAVCDGAAALNRLLGATRYDLVLLDLMMPRASGLEVLERVRDLNHRRDVPMMVLTAKGQDADRDRAFELGASDFVTKPFSPKKLLARIDELLDRT
jgi:CheY-like chemotaxis protein